MSTTEPLLIRPDEYDAVGALVVHAYEVGGVIAAEDGYRATLVDTAGRAAKADVYVLHDDAGRPVATVTVSRYGSAYAQVAREDELEFRMLAVDPEAGGRGLGSRLVEFCAERALAHGDHALVLCVIDTNAAAIRLYSRLGFTRASDRDLSPAPGVRLLVLTRAAARAAGQPGRSTS
jgi:ribosomal protein S18 acetylase RimI-like enzyme